MQVPPIGRNEVQFKQASPIFDNLEDGTAFYFVHSYYLVANGLDREVITATF